ncbi:MAG: hypothetical protein KJZ85_11140 [Rhodobacteraceae bacterium]|jgi:hypothetical protein|nr:hypothetical protein [Paracoccaceae bacterium]
MRPVLHGDVVAAARALLRVAPAERRDLVARMIDDAHIADRWRRRTGLLHPTKGNGSLMAAAATWPQAPEPFLSDFDYLDCLRTVIEALIAHRPSERRRAARPLAPGAELG